MVAQVVLRRGLPPAHTRGAHLTHAPGWRPLAGTNRHRPSGPVGRARA